MTAQRKRIAINFGSGYVPGLSSVVTGVVRAAGRLGWEVVGIHDGYDGLFHPEQYADGGTITLNPSLADVLGGSGGSILGTGARTDPFRLRRMTPDGMVEEADRSDELLALIRDANRREIPMAVATFRPRRPLPSSAPATAFSCTPPPPPRWRCCAPSRTAATRSTTSSSSTCTPRAPHLGWRTAARRASARPRRSSPPTCADRSPTGGPTTCRSSSPRRPPSSGAACCRSTSR